jgi:hypothetical protein
MSAIALTPGAEAKTRVHIGIGSGFHYGDCDYSLIFDNCWPGYSYGYRPYWLHSHHHYVYPRYHYSRKISCTGVKHSLRQRGYRDVRAHDCKGNHYSFTARLGSKKYRINVNALTGRTSRERM